MHQIIATGSKGNAILYMNAVMIDCGISYAMIKPYLKNIQFILLTHSHKDHINLTTLSRVLKEKPSIRVGYCKGCFDFIGKNFDRYEPDKTYNYGRFQITPFMLYHNVPNCGYKVQGLGKKIFHSTDTGCLFEIEAKGFDLYCIESNYDETTVYDVIEKLEAEGKFAHQKNSIKNHLSEQQALEFYLQNKGENSQLVRLHESDSKLTPEHITTSQNEIQS